MIPQNQRMPAPPPVDPKEQIQAAFRHQLQLLMRDIYLRSASAMLIHRPNASTADDFRELAKRCRVASRAYYEGLGLVEFPPDE